MLRQTGREIGVKWLVGARGETVGNVKPVEGQSELGQTSPWWIHRPGSGVAAVLKDKEHSCLRLGGTSSSCSCFTSQFVKISIWLLCTYLYGWIGLWILFIEYDWCSEHMFEWMVKCDINCMSTVFLIMSLVGWYNAVYRVWMMFRIHKLISTVICWRNGWVWHQLHMTD